jgi:integrase
MVRGRRRNGEGSIRKKKDGRWELRITLPDGKRKSYMAKTFAEAQRKKIAVLHDLESGLPVISEHMLMRDYLRTWLESKRTLEPSTIYRYEVNVRVHLVPRLGHIPLDQLTPRHLAKFYADELATGISSSTVNQMYRVLHTALKEAMMMDLVLRNVADRVKPPRMAKRKMQVYDKEQSDRLMDAARGHRMEALIVLALTTGMREGELFGLHWHYVNLETGHVQVIDALKEVGSQRYMGHPKTEESRRKVRLPAVAVEARRRHKLRQTEERLALEEAGGGWSDSGLVFTSTVGTPLTRPNFVRRDYRPLLERAGLPYIRPHDLRHTAATLHLRQGVNIKVVSEMLGHSDVMITYRTYAHVLPDMQYTASAAMDDLFGTFYQ